MDSAAIEYLMTIFSQPLVQRALAELRTAIPLRGDLTPGDEGLEIHASRDGELVATAFRVDLNDSRSESGVILTEAQREAAELLWSLGLGNASTAEREYPESAARVEFLASQGDYTERVIGLRLNTDELDNLSVNPEPLRQS